MRFKNEVSVGIVVLLGLALAFVGAIWLSGEPFGQEQRQLTAIFKEVGELSKGSAVKYRGVQIGRVTEIALAAGGQGVEVSMEVKPDVVIPADAAVVLAPASLFGDWEAQLVSMASQPLLTFTRAPVPGVLPGATLPDITQLTAVGARIAGDLETLTRRVELAFTEETALKLRQTINNVQEISEQLNGFVAAQTKTYAGVSANVLQATENIQSATEAVQKLANSSSAQIPEIVANARAASENLKDLSVSLQQAAKGVPALMARADTTLDRLNAAAGNVNELIETAKPQVAQIGPTLEEARKAMATLQATMQKINEGDGTLGRLASDPALYEETQAAIATLRRLMADIQANPKKYIGAIKIF
ncbi:MAG TPA: MlaD family protein [Longimicrobiaceae bacterium]|nr:MlaD family protein [Longimicrobiaceae bacterium]